MARSQIKGEVQRGAATGIYRLRRSVSPDRLVSIVIPTCAAKGMIKRCVDTLRDVSSYRNFEIVCIENIPPENDGWRTWLQQNADRVLSTNEPFNWSRFNNLAAAEARGEFLLFLNDDVEIIEPNWLDALLEHAQRPEVGVVGPMLLWPDRTIQSAGVFMTNDVRKLRHAFRNSGEADPGYFGLALSQRNVIAVNGACFLTRRMVFDQLRGFNEAHRVVNNETDYCFRAWRDGLHTIFTPYSKVVHHERTSRNDEGEDYDAAGFRKEWGALFIDGDPYHSPGLSKEVDSFVPEAEPVQVISAGQPLLQEQSIREILLVKLDHIGDCITAFPAIRRLKQAFPCATFRVLAGSWTKPIWPLAEVVDEVIEFNFFHDRADDGARSLREEELELLQRLLDRYHFDLAIDLRRHPETRHILQYTGARVLAGFELRGQFPWLDIALEWSGDAARVEKRNHAADELVNLADAVTAAFEPRRHVIPPISIGALRLRKPMQPALFTRPVVAVHPAAGTRLKEWPPQYFADLIDLLVQREHVNVALIGSGKDKQIASQIMQAVRNSLGIFNLVGEIELDDLPSLLLRCALFVGNDSGPKHLAAGLGIPTVGIHAGHVDAREWGPLGSSAVALQRNMECAPCYLPAAELCPRGVACLTGLMPHHVYPMCKKLLVAGPARKDEVSSLVLEVAAQSKRLADSPSHRSFARG
jgi:ADP-heptose:LPS heptosyltransferase/GT2 family glycosyltransferase